MGGGVDVLFLAYMYVSATKFVSATSFFSTEFNET